MRRLCALITMGALAMLGAACDDDNGEEGSLAAYCNVVEDLGGQADVPSAEQFEELRQAAPEEIRDEVATASEAIEEQGEDAFNDPDVVAAIEDIEAYEAANCDQADADVDVETEDGDEDVDQDVDVDVEDDDGPGGTTGTTDDTDTTDTTGDDTTTTTETTGTAPTTTANDAGPNSLY